MQQRIQIRQMNISDIPQIQRVARESWNATYGGIIPIDAQESFLLAAYSEQMLTRRFEQSILFVAEADGRIIGFANYSQMRECGEVELGAIYLLPAYQGKGIGSSLLKTGIKHFEGVKTLLINVAKENKLGRSFYNSKGFKAVDEFDDPFEGVIVKTVTMVLEIR